MPFLITTNANWIFNVQVEGFKSYFVRWLETLSASIFFLMQVNRLVIVMYINITQTHNALDFFIRRAKSLALLLYRWLVLFGLNRSRLHHLLLTNLGVPNLPFEELDQMFQLVDIRVIQLARAEITISHPDHFFRHAIAANGHLTAVSEHQQLVGFSFSAAFVAVFCLLVGSHWPPGGVGILHVCCLAGNDWHLREGWCGEVDRELLALL